MKMLSEQEKRARRVAARRGKQVNAIKHHLEDPATRERVARRMQEEIGITLDEALRFCDEALRCARAGLPQPQLSEEIRARIDAARRS